MRTRSGGRTLVIAALATVGLGAGAWVGLDAAGQVDGRYHAVPAFRWHEPRVVATPTTSWDWTSAPVAAPPPAGSIWGREVGRDERAFFDMGDAADVPPAEVEREPVRRRAARGPAPVVPDVPPAVAVDEIEDGWVAPPAPAAAREEPDQP